MLSPYTGNSPPEEIRDDTAAFFYPYGVFYRKTPTTEKCVTPENMKIIIENLRRSQLETSDTPISAPTAVLANPTDNAVTIVWDPPRDISVTGYEIRRRYNQPVGWENISIPPGHRWSIANLKNGTQYVFQMRSLADKNSSDWTDPIPCTPGPVGEFKMGSMVSSVPIWSLVRLVFHGLIHGIVTRLIKKG